MVPLITIPAVSVYMSAACVPPHHTTQCLLHSASALKTYFQKHSALSALGFLSTELHCALSAAASAEHGTVAAPIVRLHRAVQRVIRAHFITTFVRLHDDTGKAERNARSCV